MPRVYPSESFEVAAKHLFRHLHDPSHLKNNPLVQRLFCDAGTGRFLKPLEQTALEQVQGLVRRIAEQCRQADLKAGEGEHAHRQHTIATLNLLERRSMADVAATLGISMRQAYYERSNICKRIAYRLREASEPRDVTTVQIVPSFAEYEFRMHRAELRAEIGDVTGAVREYESIACHADSARRKIRALCENVKIMVGTDKLEAAATALAAARDVFNANADVLSQTDRVVSQATIELAAVILACFGGRYSQAIAMLNDARSWLESIATVADDDVKDLYVRVLISCSSYGVWLWGDFPNSVDCLLKAHEVMRKIAVPSQCLALEVGLRLCRRRNDTLQDSRVWRPKPERLVELTGAFNRALASGSLRLGLYGTICLIEYHASVGDDVRLGDDIRFALSLLKQPSCHCNCAHKHLEIADILLRTKYWQYAADILTSLSGTVNVITARPEEVEYVQAYCYLRSGAYRQAWSLCAAQRDRANPNPHIAMKMQIVGALSADALGKRRRAKTLIESALSWAERFGSAYDLREAFAAAAEITGDLYFHRTAEEIGHVLVC